MKIPHFVLLLSFLPAASHANPFDRAATTGIFGEKLYVTKPNIPERTLPPLRVEPERPSAHTIILPNSQLTCFSFPNNRITTCR